MRDRSEQARRVSLAVLAGLLLLGLIAVSVQAGQRRLQRDRGDRYASRTITAGGGAAQALGSTATTPAASNGSAVAASQLSSGSASVSAAHGSGQTAGAASGPAPIYDPGVTDTSILVGGSTFLSGPAAVYGDQLATGLQAGLDAINAAGGVNGRKFQLILYDDGADPAKQLANTKRLVEVDHVFALTMIYAPGQLGQYVSSVGIPVFTEGQFDEEFTNPWWFATGGPQRLGSIAIAEKAAQLGAKKAAIFYLNAGGGNYTDQYAQEVSSDFESLGVSVAFTESMNPTQR